MKYIILILFLSNLSYSQTISKQITGSAGNTQSNSNIKVSWTIGEPVVGLMTAEGNQLANGFYPAMNLQALSTDDNLLDLQLKIYPNPTAHLVYISHPKTNSFSIQINDCNGKQMYAGIIEKEVPLDVSAFAHGMYLITLENNETKQRNTYKIIKE